MFTSCLSGRHRLICWLDNLAHAISRDQRDGQHWLCEIHDRHLLRDMDRRIAQRRDLGPWVSEVNVVGPVCEVACDNDCDAGCHELHQPESKRAHSPKTCPGTAR